MNDSKAIFKYTVFFIGYVLLLFFILATSAHEHEYMLSEVGSEFTSWCQLPMEKDPARKEMYVIFLVLFSVMGFVFLKKKNHVLIACMLIIFCYATYAFILRDIMCSIF